VVEEGAEGVNREGRSSQTMHIRVRLMPHHSQAGVGAGVADPNVVQKGVLEDIDVK
jgi:hypothetical protein